MIAIVIKRTLSDKELSYIRSLIEGTPCTVISSISLPSDLSKLNRGIYIISEETKKQINFQSMDFIISFGDKQFEGRPVVEWLKFDDSSIWYYHKFRAYFRFRKIKYEIAEIQKLSAEYEKVIYYTDDPLLAKSDFPDNVVISGPRNLPNKKQNISSLTSYGIILASRSIINLFSSGKLKYPQHIIMDISKQQVCLDINTMKEKKANYQLAYVFDKAGKDFLIIDEAVQPKMTDGARISLRCDHLFGKGGLKGRYFGEGILLKYFLSTDLRKRKKKLIDEVYKSLSSLDELCTGDDKLMISIYRSFRGATNFYFIKYLAYKRFFKKYSFKTISTIDENSPAQRSILDAARTAGMKTIGMQHGNLHDLHPAYIYSESDQKRNAFPQHNIIWGNFWKNFLIKNGSYPEDSLIISGQFRTDVIPAIQKADIKKEAVLSVFDIEEKLIVFASQPQRDPELRARAALDVMMAVKATPKAFLVIKLHPNERNDHEYYAQMARKVGLDRILITLSIDLYLLISVCDILITCFSTVGTETIYFGKPLIILDHLKQDIQNYHKEGVALQATNAEELELHISNILNGYTKINSEAYSQFISKYAFAIDGKAADRALSFIRSL